MYCHHHQTMDMFSSASGYEGYTESSYDDMDDQDDIESSFGDHAQIILSNLDESIERIDDYLAYERGFVHGDIVCSIKDPFGQMGQVMDVDMIVDLESTTGEIIKEVNSKNLCKLQSFGEGDYVINGSWLGRVVRVYDLVTILLDDGTKCEVSAGDQCSLTPISDFPFEGPCIYHLGQRVKVNHSASFKFPRCFCGTWFDDQCEGTICKVEVGTVVVKWISSVLAASDSTPPPCHQNTDNLTLLSCFQYTNWQHGDWCRLSPSYLQSLTASEDHDFASTDGCSIKMKKLGTKDHACKKMFVITKTKTTLDVLWQDGNLTPGLDLQTLFPMNTVGEHDFWPGQFVLEKTLSEDVHVRRFGIIKTVHGTDRLLKVKWITQELDCSTDGKRDEVETVSAYEVFEHPDYSYCLGDIVFRMLPHFESSTVTLSGHKSMQNKKHGYPPLGLEHFSLHHYEENIARDQMLSDSGQNTNCYLSCIGNVIGFKDGVIEVRWASGVTSKVKPFEVLGIENFPNHGGEIVEASEDEISNQEGSSFQKKGKELDLNDSREDCMESLLCSNALQFPSATVGLIMNFAARYFGFHGSSSLSNDYSEVPDMYPRPYVEPLHSENPESFKRFEKISMESIPTVKDVDKPASKQVNLDINFPLNVKKMFKKFDMVTDCSDHHFVGAGGKNTIASQVKRSWFKKVQQEWSILEEDLPDTIYVRVYEERMDLLRASITGAAGTPYQDALFFFDFCFPPEYPHEPPLVHYISSGLRLNPNLYESGRVCLSLLKTWTGIGTEVWNPERSNILQVLLSLQALVLNDKPYFNEAGYDKQIGRAEGERNSITYNENAFLLSRKSMLYQLQNPPKHFEELVKEHFASQSHQILRTCKAYINGTHVGYDSGCGDVTSKDQRTTSTGFKIMLSKLFPKLVSAFAEKGIDCSQSLDHQKTLVLEPDKDSA